jgi:RhtB (resistance to homoserine/threonine) family protein
MTDWAAFFALSVLLIVTPGPDTALVLRNSIWGGREAGAATAAGVGTGLATWTVAASLGIAALIQASEPAFLALKLVGAAYLAYLGVQALRSAFRQSDGHASADLVPRSRVRPATALRQGVLSNLANPKSALFFTSLLPQFVPPSSHSFLALLELGFIFCGITSAWLLAYAVAAARVGGFLRRPRVRRAMDGVTGFVLIGFGLRLAAERR